MFRECCDGLLHDEILKCQTFQFGKFEQDNDINNGKENIEWILIRRVDDKVLLISKYVLDCKCYDEKSENYHNLSWSKCDLNRWLNEEFFNETFTDNEKNMMYKYDNDYVIILDREEIKYLLGAELNYPNPSLMAQPTEFATKTNNHNSYLNITSIYMKDVYGDDYDISYNYCEYWVRQDKEGTLFEKEAYVIDASGRLKDDYVVPNYKVSGIRPVICIDLEE